MLLRVAVPVVLSARLSAPPVDPIELFIETVPALKVSVLAVRPTFAIGELIAMLLVAAKVTSAIFRSVVNAVAVIWLLAPANLVTASKSVGNTMSAGGTGAGVRPPMFATVPTVMSAGSSSKAPRLPRRELRSAVPAKYSTCLPEVSPKPPSPP